MKLLGLILAGALGVTASSIIGDRASMAQSQVLGGDSVSADADSVPGAENPDPAATDQYWTGDRMRRANPLDLPRAKPGDPGDTGARPPGGTEVIQPSNPPKPHV
jgi:hypothetical protein